MRLNSYRVLTVAAGVALALAAAYLLWLTFDFPPGRRREPGPALWPRIVLTVIIVMAGIIAFGALHEKRDRNVIDPGRALAPFGLMALLFAYFFAFTPLGYYPATVIFFLAALWMLRVRSWKVLTGVSLGFPLVVYLVFERLLNARFPRGVLEMLAGS